MTREDPTESLVMIVSLDSPHHLPPLADPAELAELRRKMRRPQRHRLLHDYPLAAAMLDFPTNGERGVNGYPARLNSLGD